MASTRVLIVLWTNKMNQNALDDTLFQDKLYYLNLIILFCKAKFSEVGYDYLKIFSRDDLVEKNLLLRFSSKTSSGEDGRESFPAGE
ncbi:hypothetical protein RUM43_000852 [Polyplax serrata]|uniref:Uncharacterized protein n=1 Tax=Polyplax serrata TaxID=468196 RepID=A0AAN8SHT2_POLSC